MSNFVLVSEKLFQEINLCSEMHYFYSFSPFICGIIILDKISRKTEKDVPSLLNFRGHSVVSTCDYMRLDLVVYLRPLDWIVWKDYI